LIYIHIHIFSDAMDGHFLRKFGWGNKTSLQTEPEARGVDACLQLREFHRKHYYPSNCKLVLLSPLSLEAMIDAAMQSFGEWRAGKSTEETVVVVGGDDNNGGDDGAVSCDDVTLSVSAAHSSEPTIFTQVFGPLSASASVSSAARLYRIVPMRKNYHWLTLTWMLPPTIHMYR
jgi:hypothetical protein